MKITWRQDLETYLAGFVASHRGLRFGRMFGAPAGFAGHKLFCCVFEDGITAKLPAAARERALQSGASEWRPMGRVMKEWVVFRPRQPRALEAIGPFLELAARYVAEDPPAPPKPAKAVKAKAAKANATKAEASKRSAAKARPAARAKRAKRTPA